MLEYFILFLVILCVLVYLFPFIQIVGSSMHPTYQDGEIILGTKLFRKSKLKVGDIVVYRSPMFDSKVVIKRIKYIRVSTDNLYFYCVGDNLIVSHDSRHYGFISSKNIICKVINQRGKM